MLPSMTAVIQDSTGGSGPRNDIRKRNEDCNTTVVMDDMKPSIMDNIIIIK